MTLSPGRLTPVRGRRPRPRGFTLVELLVVIVIIGIVSTLVAAASISAAALAEKRATQSLITKLQTAVADRMEVLASQPVEPNGAHRYLAAVTPANFQGPINPTGALPHPLPWGLPSEERARTIARIEFVKMNMPDVFFVQWTADASGQYSAGAANSYPLNFGGLPYPNYADAITPAAAQTSMILPMGNTVFPAYLPELVNSVFFAGGSAMAWQTGPGAATSAITGPWQDSVGTPDIRWSRGGTGINGASYAAAAGIYKNLGYLPTGTDGVDNDGNGFVDEWGEGVNASNQATVLERMSKHQHSTARSEMLYALLVEGIGPMGSVFSPDDFTDNEVKDTDGDGLLEFVDAWGKPLQFYRWPVFYGNQPLQKGVYDAKLQNWTVYAMGEERQRNPLDPGNYLVDPAWWRANVNWGDGIAPLANVFGPGVKPNGMSGRALTFQAFFGPLSTPDAVVATVPATSNAYTDPTNIRFLWDNSWVPGSGTPRQAFYSKPLIISGGPDGKIGFYQMEDPKQAILTGDTANVVVQRLIGAPPYAYDTAPGENNALIPLPPIVDSDGVPLAESTYDNITNQELDSSTGGAL